MMNSEHVREAAERIATLRDQFVHHERFTQLPESFSILAENRIVDIETGRVSEARCLALSGHSGAGKTTAIRHLVARERTDYRLTDMETSRS